jgi:zeaxanthin glucosyltransferase
MANVVFFLDAEEGHILSTLELARQLAIRGHRVTYLSFPSAEGLIVDQGFSFVPMFQNIIPKGVRSLSSLGASGFFAPLVGGEALDVIVETIKPSVFLVMTVMGLEAIALRYRYNIPVVLVRPQFILKPRKELHRGNITARLLHLGSGAPELLDLLGRRKIPIGNFDDIADLALQMPELVLFPSEFASTPETGTYQPPYYVSTGPEPPMHRRDPPWVSPFSGEAIVYCALGSQSYLRPDVSERLFRVVLEAFNDLLELRLILSTGKGHMFSLNPAGSNAFVTDWVPQLLVLSRAVLMINHGGSGTVKECIVNGVPMIALPLMRDQFECADLIHRFGLGIRAEMNNLTPTTLKGLVLEIISNIKYRDNVLRMREYFTRCDWTVAVDVVEKSCEGFL